MHGSGTTVGGYGKAVTSGLCLLLGAIIHVPIRVSKRQQRIAKQCFQLSFIFSYFMGLLLGGELAQPWMGQGMAPNLHMAGGHQCFYLLPIHQGNLGIRVGGVFHVPTIMLLSRHHIYHGFVPVFFKQWQHAGKVVLVAVIGGDHQVLLAIFQAMNEAPLSQIAEGQRLVAQPFQQAQMLLKHGNRHPGTMNPLLAVMLDKAVIHNDRHLPAQGLDYSILIDRLQPGYYPLQAILSLNALANNVRHTPAGQRRQNLRLQGSEVDRQILGAYVTKVAGQRLRQILFSHQTNRFGLADGKRRAPAQQCLHCDPTSPDH